LDGQGFNMSQRAKELIQQLGLQPHPEGGFYREIYRSEIGVQVFTPPQSRSAVTSIFFLLLGGQFSCLHLVDADEIWHYYEGDPLELTWGPLDGTAYHQQQLGPVDQLRSPVIVVPANFWQAARSLGDYTLVGCTVSPGFEFREFRMLHDDPQQAAEIQTRYPELANLI
jgi:predicted cupin superfamily sugar epimerase